MAWNYDSTWSYDYDAHWEVAQWIAEHGRVAPVDATVESFHPPLYYAMLAWFIRHGFTQPNMVWLSIAFGVTRLAIIWAGLELYVKNSRLARVVALSLAAVIYASVHIDGMVYPEALSCLWHAVIMLLLPRAFRSAPMKRWPAATLIGVLIGCAMMTKISGVVVLAVIGIIVALEFMLSRAPLTDRFNNAVPWSATLVLALALSGWFIARNIATYGQPILTSFDLPYQQHLVASARQKPYLDRRTLGFVFGWDKSLFTYPFSQYNFGPNPRFFPVAIATTFEDFWGYGYEGYERPYALHDKTRQVRPRAQIVNVSRCAFLGGSVICAATLVALACVGRYLLRIRDYGRLALVAIPVVTTLAALHFAINFPADGHGVTKGVYMTFGAPPLYALFGVAVAWAARRVERWPILVALVAALGLVAAYSLECRLGLHLVPA